MELPEKDSVLFSQIKGQHPEGGREVARSAGIVPKMHETES